MTASSVNDRSSVATDPGTDDFMQRLNVAIQRAGGATAMAKQAGVSTSVLRKWRSGQSEPTLRHLCQLAKAAQLSVGWLAAGEGRMDSPTAWPTVAEAANAYTLSGADTIDHLPVELYAKMVTPLHELGKTPDERQAILTATLRLLGVLKLAGAIEIDKLDEADLLPIIQVALLADGHPEDSTDAKP